MGDPVSSTRLYLGNLPMNVTKDDITTYFQDGPGNISEIKIMNGFGFLEYEDAADARDVVPHFHGSEFKGNRLTVQFARGTRPRDYPPQSDRPRPPRPRRTAFRMQITSLPVDTSWQDLKDFARRSGLDVVYSEIGRERDGRGFVEFETAQDLKVAVDKLDNNEFKGNAVRCIADIQDEVPSGGRYERYGRSRSPPPFRSGGYPPRGGYYDDRRGPPPPRGGYRDDDYRRRSPPPRDDPYYGGGRHGGYRSPPRGPPRGPPIDEPYPPARGAYREPDPYAAPPPRRAPYDDPYVNGYDRAPPRRTPPPRGYGGYDERAPRAYW